MLVNVFLAISLVAVLTIYVRTALVAKKVLWSNYNIVNRTKAFKSVLFPWLAIQILSKDLAIKRAALDLADKIGIDKDELERLAVEGLEAQDG